MPFTPFHMGPGMAFKAALPEKFSLMVFGWSQIVMDIQPLIAMVNGEEIWHGVTHTFVGGAVLGALSAVTGKYLTEWGVRLISLGRKRIKIGWRAAFLSGLVGGLSHVLIDGFLHHDMQPFWPFWPGNPILVFNASFAQVEMFCLVSGAVGAFVYLLVKILNARKKRLQQLDEP